MTRGLGGLLGCFSPDRVVASGNWHCFVRGGSHFLCLLCCCVHHGSRGIPYSRRSISTAPVRGGSHFLCCCKESNQRKQLSPSKVLHTGRGTGDWPNGPPVASALTSRTRLGSRTIRLIAQQSLRVQHEIAPARFAADRSIGSACASLLTLPSHCMRSPLVSLVGPAAARSAVPMLFCAEPVSLNDWLVRPCASQALFCL